MLFIHAVLGSGVRGGVRLCAVSVRGANVQNNVRRFVAVHLARGRCGGITGFRCVARDVGGGSTLSHGQIVVARSVAVDKQFRVPACDRRCDNELGVYNLAIFAVRTRNARTGICRSSGFSGGRGARRDLRVRRGNVRDPRTYNNAHAVLGADNVRIRLPIPRRGGYVV